MNNNKQIEELRQKIISLRRQRDSHQIDESDYIEAILKLLAQEQERAVMEALGEDEDYDKTAALHGNTQACVKAGRNALRAEIRGTLKEA